MHWLASVTRAAIIFAALCRYVVNNSSTSLINNDQGLIGISDAEQAIHYLWPLLLTWINFNPGMDK